MTFADDDLSIPDFLRVSEADRAKARAKQAETASPAPRFVPAPIDPSIAARHEAIRKEKAARKIAKLKNHLAKKNDRGAKPKDYDPDRHIWNPAKGRFEVDKLVLLREQWAEQERRAASPLVEMRNVAAGIPVQTAKPASTPRMAKPPKQPDDLAARAATYDRPQLVTFAKANGCWDDKYSKLPNPGLVRMNVINRLRAKVRKGHKVIWN